MKKIVLVYAIAAFIACSCTGMQEAPEISGVPMALTAYQEGTPDTRTAVENGGKQVFWEPGDEIKVFSGSRSGKFTSSAESLEAVTTFTGHLEGNEPDVADIWAVYPYSDDASFDGETITTVIPSVQVARPGTFAQGANVAIAHSTTTSLQFYNVGGGIRFSLTEEGVKKVIFEGLGGEVISGTVKVGFEDGVPKVKEVSSGSIFLTLTPPEGEAFIPGQWYYLTAMPGTLEKGFKMRFYKDDTYAKVVSDKTYTIKRRIFGSVQNINQHMEYESITTNFPETKEEMIQSFEITQNLAEDINTIIEKKRGEIEGYVPDAQVVADQITSMESIINAKPNSSGKMIDVVQRDGARFSVILEREGLVHDVDGSTKSISNFISSRAIMEPSNTRNSIVPSGNKKALLLAPYQHGYVYRKTNEKGEVIEERQMGNLLVDANYVRGLLSSAGYSLRYLEDDKVGIQHFYGDSLSKYDLIIVLTHGGENGWICAGRVDPESFIDKYEDSFQEGVHYYRYIDNGYVEIGVSSEWLEATTTADYPNSIVYFGACHSYENTLFNNYFHRHKAKAYAGFAGVAYFREYGDMNQTRDIMYCLMRSLCYGMSFSQAVNHIHDYSDIWTLEYKAFCYLNPYTFNNTSEDNVFLIDPHPFDLQNTVNNNIVTVSWKNPQTAGDYRYRVKIYRDGVSERWYKPQTTRGVTISDLEPGTYSWLVQADLYYDGKMFESYTTDGEPFTIKQTSQGNDDPTPEAIDLGLSVKWASFNLGASKPEEYGDYFAWGETEPKMSYSWDNYLWGKENSITRYNAQDNIHDFRNYGYVDDAANKLLKGYWHVPSSSEYKELIDNSSYEWCILNGTPGMKFTSTKSGFTNRWIFLPATGGKIYSSLISPENGYYWSSTVSEGNKNAAVSLSFFSSSDNASVSDAMRYAGQVIRPVCD